MQLHDALESVSDPASFLAFARLLAEDRADEVGRKRPIHPIHTAQERTAGRTERLKRSLKLHYPGRSPPILAYRKASRPITHGRDSQSFSTAARFMSSPKLGASRTLATPSMSCSLHPNRSVRTSLTGKLAQALSAHNQQAPNPSFKRTRLRRSA